MRSDKYRFSYKRNVELEQSKTSRESGMTLQKFNQSRAAGGWEKCCGEEAQQVGLSPGYEDQAHAAVQGSV